MLCSEVWTGCEYNLWLTFDILHHFWPGMLSHTFHLISRTRTHTIPLSHTHTLSLSLSLCRSKWLPVSIQVKNGELVIKKSTPPSLTSAAPPPPPSPPLHEFRLSHNHTMTEPISRAYDRKTKVHQVRHHNFCFSSHLFHCLSLLLSLSISLSILTGVCLWPVFGHLHTDWCYNLPTVAGSLCSKTLL